MPSRRSKWLKFVSRPTDYETLLGRILDEAGESLRCIAAHHVGELELRALRPRLVALQKPGASDFFLSRIVERALRRLPPTREDQTAHA